MKWRPFIEWRPNEIGIGFSLSVERVRDYAPDKEMWPALGAERWCPNIWIHIGPLVGGIGWESR